MKIETDSEKNYIKIIIGEIASRLQLGDPEQLQQRDYENLSVLIQEKTGISLSVSTLKRISKNQFQNIPQKNTLNALAQFLDYKDWYDFKSQHQDSSDSTGKSQKVKKTIKFDKRIAIIPVAAIIIFAIIVLILNSQPAQSYAEAQFSSRKNVSSGVPNTVIFNYDISMYDFDSAFIQQSWDTRRRVEIKKNEKYSTSVYYYPGYHRAKIMINDQLVKEIPVYITTEGWLSLIQNPGNDLIPIYVNENCISNGQMYMSPETIEAHHIDLSHHNHSTSFYYVNDDFCGDSDNFSFETRVKNNIDEGGLACQVCEVSIFGEYGRHVIQLSNPGCIGSLFQKFGQKYIMGKNNDLSAFGIDMNNWNDLKLSINNRIATIYINGQEIYKTSYDKGNGAIKGIFYHFGGSGAVDYARLFDNNNKLVFSEDFNNKLTIR